VKFAEGFYVGVEDSDVKIADEDQDAGAGVAAVDADVMQPTVVAQGDHCAGVDAVVADPVVAGVEGGAGRDGLWPSLVGLFGSSSAERSVGSNRIVVAAGTGRVGPIVAGRWWRRAGEPAISSASGGTARSCRRSVGGRAGSGENGFPGRGR